MKEFDKLFESILSETSRGNVPRIDHDDKATMYGAPVHKLVKNTKELDAKYGKPKPNKEPKLERKYPAKAPKGDSFIKGGPRDGQPSRVDSRTSTTDKYVRTHKNPTTTHAKKFGEREESYIQEDGHTDISSVNKQLHIAAKALATIKDQISNLPCGSNLPTWWMNKIAISIDKLDGMADYLDATVPESIDQLEEKKADRCKRKADSVYGKKTSAYKSGAIVRCRQGKIWKKK